MASSDGFPPEGLSPSEDTVECRLYPLIDQEHETEQELCVRAMKYSQFLKELTCDYIWYHEDLRISVSRSGCVMVCVAFRDGIEDEWYLVSLMCRLTETFADLVVSISDGDGEFLLIEAAHYLPLWLKPETSTNRVFIHGGCVHIIPKPTNPAEILHYPVATPTLQQALSLVRSDTHTEASSLIQEAINQKIKQQIHSPHFTHCYVPMRVAHVIHHNRQLVAAAVHAMCDRDVIDMKACRKMTTFPVDKCIMSGVIFTRRLYAQLLREQFQAPRNAGFHHYGSGTAYDLGIKLTCGFEMLMSSLRRPVAAENVSDSDPLWLQFISSLQQKGYFQGQLEGSKLYNELKEKAKHFYKESMVEDNRGPRLIHAECVQHIINDLPVDKHQLEQQNLPPPDSDDWLEITPAQLDHMIYEAQGVTKGAGLDSVVDGMTSFVDHVSSFEGVEFPSDTTGVTLNPDQFMSQLRDMLQEDEEELLSDDDITCSSNSSDEGEQEGEGLLHHVMQQMDKELVGTTMAQSFDHVQEEGLQEQQEGEGLQQQQEEGELRPVDIDFNLVKNLLESYASQDGGAGPTSNILQSMGIKLPEQ